MAFLCSENNSRKLEKIQERALKIINGRPRECHNKKVQSIPSTRRKRNLPKTETIKLHVNNSRKTSSLFPNRGLFILNISTYDELLLKANNPSLHIRRLKTMSIETFKILNEMAPPVLSNLARLKDNSRCNFEYNNILQVPQVGTW